MIVPVEELLQPTEPKEQREKTKFLTLKNDEDIAIVRFLHKDYLDVETVNLHRVPFKDFSLKVDCLRSTKESYDKCPICRDNTQDPDTEKWKYPRQKRCFIHLLKYDNPQTAVEMIWERGEGVLKKLKDYTEDFGPLYTRLYKIIRHGAAGSTATTYEIIPLDKDRYNPSNFTFDEKQLNWKSVIGDVVLEKTAEEMEEYLKSGSFPLKNKKVAQKETPKTVEKVDVIDPFGPANLDG